MSDRGIRNNNPGNIDYDPKVQWRGQLGIEIIPPGLSETPRFARFDSPENGIRAIGRTLIAYQDLHQCRSPRALIGRWAPPNENDTDAYAADVAAALGVDVDAPVDVHQPATLAVLARAIIRQENGADPYDDATVADAIQSALA